MRPYFGIPYIFTPNISNQSIEMNEFQTNQGDSDTLQMSVPNPLFMERDEEISHTYPPPEQAGWDGPRRLSSSTPSTPRQQRSRSERTQRPLVQRSGSLTPTPGSQHRRSRSPEVESNTKTSTVVKTRLVEQKGLAIRKAMDEKDVEIQKLQQQLDLLTQSMSTFEDMLKMKDKTHAAAMETERKRREEIESLVLSLQRNYNAGQQPNSETNITQARTQSEGPANVSADPTDGVPVIASIDFAPAPDDVEMVTTGASREDIPLTPLTPVTEHSATASNSNHQLIAPNASDDDEMRDASQTISKWQFRTGKERYVSVHSSDEDDPEFHKNLLDDDDDMNLYQEDDDLGPLVPPPHKYTRPRVPKFAYHKATWNTPKYSHQVPLVDTPTTSHAGPSASVQPTPDDRPVHLSDLQTLVQMMSSSIAQSITHAVQGMQSEIVTPKRRVVVSTKVRADSTRRTKEPLKAALLSPIRREMQRLIGITQDAAIGNISLPLESAVNAFANDLTQRGPTLQPMRFAFNCSYSHPWNHELADKFVSRIVGEQHVDEDDVPLVHEICRQRFNTLQGIWRKHQVGEGEDRVDVAKRLQERKGRTGSRSRKNTRRQTLYYNRIEIVTLNSDDGTNVFWTFLADVVASLGLGGMSEDDSGDERQRDRNRDRKFVVKTFDWRSARLVPYLDYVDRAKQPINAFGKLSPGNVPRERIRQVGGRIIQAQAVPGLPRNFYDEMWFAGLSMADKSVLKVVNSVEFPPVP